MQTTTATQALAEFHSYQDMLSRFGGNNHNKSSDEWQMKVMLATARSLAEQEGNTALLAEIAAITAKRQQPVNVIHTLTWIAATNAKNFHVYFTPLPDGGARFRLSVADWLKMVDTVAERLPEYTATAITAADGKLDITIAKRPAYRCPVCGEALVRDALVNQISPELGACYTCPRDGWTAQEAVLKEVSEDVA